MALDLLLNDEMNIKNSTLLNHFPNQCQTLNLCLNSPLERSDEIKFLENKIQFATSQTLLKLQNADDVFKNKLLKSLRLQLIELTPHLLMSEERKSYLIHQTIHVHDIDDLISLVIKINQDQAFLRTNMISSCDVDLILLSESNQGLVLKNVSFSKIAGLLNNPLTLNIS
jgi:hypothetical protein